MSASARSRAAPLALADEIPDASSRSSSRSSTASPWWRRIISASGRPGAVVRRGDVDDLVAGQVALGRQPQRVGEVVDVDVGSRSSRSPRPGRAGTGRGCARSCPPTAPTTAGSRCSGCPTAAPPRPSAARRSAWPARTGPAAAPGSPRRSARTAAATSRSGKKIPGTVSLDTFTKRGTPQRTAASSTLNVAIRLLENTRSGGWCSGSGIAAAWITASCPRTTANASPECVRSAWK